MQYIPYKWEEYNEVEDSDIMDDLEEDDDEDRLNVWVMVIWADLGQCAMPVSSLA